MVLSAYPDFCIEMIKSNLSAQDQDFFLGNGLKAYWYTLEELENKPALQKKLKNADFWMDPIVQKWVSNEPDLDADYTIIIRDKYCNNKICAYVCFDVDFGYEAHITFLVVDENYRHLGLSQKLLAMVENIALQKRAMMLTLYVFCQNSVAIKAYEKYGFLKS